jgi:hypothetical protein
VPWTNETPFQALALSGGGYRGLFTAKALAVMEAHTGRPIGQHFDLVAGTSIGGIIALAVAFESPMAQVVDVFEKHGADIFPPQKKPTSALGRLVDLLRFWSKPRYSDEALRSVISKFIPADATLADAKHAVAIPAVNVTEGRPQVFKTRHVAAWNRDWKTSAVEIALATAAAPTYFSLTEIGNNLFADGGLFANAPDLIALHEAEYFFNVSPSAIRLLSVGTTTQKYSVSYSAGRRFGIQHWMSDQRLINVIISAQQQFVDQIALHRLGDNYFRIDQVPSDEQARDLGLDVATDVARKTLLGLAEKAVTNVLGTRLDPYLHHTPQLQLVRNQS